MVITPAEYEPHLIAVIMLTNLLFQRGEINLFVLFRGSFSLRADLKKEPRVGFVTSFLYPGFRPLRYFTPVTGDDAGVA